MDNLPNIVGLAAAGMFLAAVAGCAVYHAWRKMRKIGAIFSLFALAAIVYGGSKPVVPTAHITFDDGLSNNGSYISTNDYRTIVLNWRYASWIPPTATVVLRAILTVNGGNEAALFDVASAPVTALTLSATMPTDATNYLYFAECDYTPAPSVVTNGVYHVPCSDAGFSTNSAAQNKWMPIGATIEIQRKEGEGDEEE